MDNFKYKLYRFMQGRYGNDSLSMFLLVFTIILLVLNIFVIQNGILSWLIWIILIWNVFRTYSRNITKRNKENEAFLKITSPFRKQYSRAKKQSQDKSHKYFICPSCKQIVRVPKGKGKITITCPSCSHKFDKKS